MGESVARAAAQAEAAVWIEKVPERVKAQLLAQFGPISTWAIHTCRSMMVQFPAR
jgi:hypothetical protein